MKYVVVREMGDDVIHQFRSFHCNRVSAEEEAERLAIKHKGAAFLVFGLVGRCKVGTVQWMRYEEPNRRIFTSGRYEGGGEY